MDKELWTLEACTSALAGLTNAEREYIYSIMYQAIVTEKLDSNYYNHLALVSLKNIFRREIKNAANPH